MLDNYIFFYSMILANNPDDVLDWDVFLDALDNDKDLIEQLNGLVLDYQRKEQNFTEVVDTNGEKKS
ncbi:MAG: hypothetical protein NC131_14660 [Roseburia sp.]|nr:hypothetical protein [Roseburia sp.]